MKVKTNELIGPALDWAVAMCQGIEKWQYDKKDKVILIGYGQQRYCPSTDWAWGGPIMEREFISFRIYFRPDSPAHGTYYARICRESGTMICWSKHDSTGPTPLVAAMRCLVFSRHGKEIEIPEELA